MSTYDCKCDYAADYEREFNCPIESILDCFGIFSCIRDENSNIIDFCVEYVNDAACECNQLTREEQVGKGLLQILPAHKESGLFDEYCRLVETGQPVIKRNYFYEDIFGQKRLTKAADIRAVKFKDGYAAIWREIPEYMNLDKALKESEECFKSVFEHSAIGMAITSPDGRMLRVNHADAEITGYSEEEMSGMDFKDISYPDDYEIEMKYLTQVLDGKIPSYQMEKRFIHKDGHIIWTIMSVSGVRNNDGVLMYFIGQIQDITSIKQANEALIYDKLRSEFFANISHELRTPINIIFSALQLFDLYINRDQFGNNMENAVRHIDVMKQNCYRLIRLINNLIEATKVDAGFYNMNLQNLDIVQIVEDITSSVADYVKSKGLKIQFDTDVEEKVILCDPDKIERIMLNLLSNAVKFSNTHGTIEVLLEEKADYINILVKDNGIGIEKEKLEGIFERFKQADMSFTRSHEGSGIGLSLVKTFVEQHGGSISVESEYGRGSIFTVKLPVRLDKDSLESEEESASKINSLKDNHVERINIEFSDIYSV